MSDLNPYAGEVDRPTRLSDAIQAAVEAEQRRVDRAIRGAIRAGYDGVDINRPDGLDGGIQIVSIEPWHRPAPDAANGHRTERYTWDWYSDDTLADLLTDDDFRRYLAEEER